MEGIQEIARLCNWSEKDINDLMCLVWEELVEIDNALYDTFDRTQNRELAYLLWETKMEELRRWLSLIMGIKIRYV